MQSSSYSLPIESNGPEARSLKTWPWVASLESCVASSMVVFLCDAIISPFATATVGPESVSCTFLQIFQYFRLNSALWHQYRLGHLLLIVETRL